MILGHSSTTYPKPRKYFFSCSDNQSQIWIYGGWVEVNVGAGLELLSDFWVFNTNNFTWVRISSEGTLNFGAKGVSSSSYYPGQLRGAVCWIDGEGGMYVFGGRTTLSTLHVSQASLWRYYRGAWSWVDGPDPNTGDYSGIYPLVGQVGYPAARAYPSLWQVGNMTYIFGGVGSQASATYLISKDHLLLKIY